jgi:undecaprenyl diphosphate synthase
MDGNRRWAKARGLPIIAGHEKGAKTLTEVAKAAKDLGIKYITVYAFSTENWKREKSEVEGLMNLLRKYLKESFKELEENNARIMFIGERDMLASDIVADMEKIEERTAKNDGITLCVALSYGGRQEIVATTKKIAELAQNGGLNIKDIDEKKFSDMLYTKDLPDPDLLIRTSGEERISNFLLWQLSYSEFYFSDTLWPDFSKEELVKIIDEYKNRERRYGKS